MSIVTSLHQKHRPPDHSKEMEGKVIDEEILSESGENCDHVDEGVFTK